MKPRGRGTYQGLNDGLKRKSFKRETEKKEKREYQEKEERKKV